MAPLAAVKAGGLIVFASVISLRAQAAQSQSPQNQSATSGPQVIKPPAVLHWCSQHCGTWTLDNGPPYDKPHYGSQTGAGIVVVERFTRESILMYRMDFRPYPGKAVLTGRISPDGNSIPDGTIEWTYHPCCGLSKGHFQAAWGAAINSVPGGDEERARIPPSLVVPELNAPEESAPPTAVAVMALEALPVPDFSDLKTGPPSVDDPDINGMWQEDLEPPTRYRFPGVKMFLIAFRHQLVAVNLERTPFLGSGSSFMTASYSTPNFFKAHVRDFNDSGLLAWYDADLNFPSRDQMRIFVGALKEEKRFTRISRVTPGEVACNPRNPDHISGSEALARSYVYKFHYIDERAAACWSYVGAVAGDPVAQLFYGDELSQGKHVPKDERHAFRLYQLSAMAGYWAAAKRLGEVFDAGTIAPESNQRSNYWSARADWLDPDYVHTKTFLPITKWATDTAIPCDPANSRHLDGDSIFRAGRVAFEARAGDMATCWFTLSSEQGSLRADVYLGVMYYFGIGVKPNRPYGLERLKRASDGGDPFGKLYLANLFRWGIGIKENQQLSYSLMQEVMRTPQGPEVFGRVQGIALTERPDSFRKEQACENARRAERPGDQQSHARAENACNSDLVTPFMTPGRHTVDHPEEIFPEVFDPITLPIELDIKERANVGWTRLTQ